MKATGCILGFLAALLVFPVSAQPAEGYYSPAGGKAGKALQQALHDIIAGHHVLAYDTLYACFENTDIKPDSTVWDMYSDTPGGTPAYLYYYGSGRECGNYKKESDCYNREHSFPKSWFNDQPPMNTDLFHIYPTDGYVNNRRANYPFGETDSPSWISANGSKLGPGSWPGYSGIVFEPIDAYKGDFARTCFYMATRYFEEDISWKGSDMVTGAEPKPWAREMLLAWHRRDTVSVKERTRNNEVQKFQKNRNPFIDHPGFAFQIWEAPNSAPEITGSTSRPVIYPNPASRFVTVKISDVAPAAGEVSVYNGLGSRVLVSPTANKEITLPVGDLRPGLYLVKWEIERKVFCGSFVKAFP